MCLHIAFPGWQLPAGRHARWCHFVAGRMKVYLLILSFVCQATTKCRSSRHHDNGLLVGGSEWTWMRPLLLPCFQCRRQAPQRLHVWPLELRWDDLLMGWGSASCKHMSHFICTLAVCDENGSIQEIRSSGLCSLDENSVKSQLGRAHVNAALGSSGGGQPLLASWGTVSPRMRGKPLRLSPRPRTQRSQSEYRSANSSSKSISRARGNREHASAASVTSEAALGSCGFSAIAKLGPRFQTSGRISRDTPAAGTSRYFRALLGLCQPESEDDWVQPRIERG